MLNFMHFAISFLRAVSYLSTAFGWLWVAMLVTPRLVESGFFEFFIQTPPEASQPTAITVSQSPILLAVAAVVTVIMIVLSIVILWQLPKKVSKTGHQVTHHFSGAILPVLTHHKKIPKKKRQILSERLVVYIRLVLIVLPLIGVVFLPASENLDYSVGLIVSGLLAFIASLSILLEYLGVSLQTRFKA